MPGIGKIQCGETVSAQFQSVSWHYTLAAHGKYMGFSNVTECTCCLYSYRNYWACVAVIVVISLDVED